MAMSSTQSIQSNIIPLHPVAPTDWETVIKNWLSVKRSPHTRRAYQNDLDHFLQDGLTLGQFLSDRHFAYEAINSYRGNLLKSGCSPSSINRKLSTIKSLAAYSYQCGHSEFMLETVKLEKSRNYRDTSGIDAIAFKEIFTGCDRSTLQGLRDYAILSLLWANALRRSEVSQCNVCDFNPKLKTLRIFGKGRGTEAETIVLGESTKEAISSYLQARATKPDDPLFVAHKAGYEGRRLSTNCIRSSRRLSKQ
jgi:integrase/recombinase XerC